MKNHHERIRDVQEIYKVLKSFGISENTECLKILDNNIDLFIKGVIVEQFKLSIDTNSIFLITLSMCKKSGVQLLTPLSPSF